MFASFRKRINGNLFPTTSAPVNVTEINFDPEEITRNKELWTQQQAAQERVLQWPAQYYEHFLVVGLPPDNNFSNIAVELVKGFLSAQHSEGFVESPTFKPQVLFSYPPDKQLPVPEEYVAGFCFPKGVAPELLPRNRKYTLQQLFQPSYSRGREEQCFVFFLKAADMRHFPLYGICMYSMEMIHRPPHLAKHNYQGCAQPYSKYMIAAPRCYCLLSHYPFFDLHFSMLRMLVDSERALTCRELASELTTMPFSPESSLKYSPSCPQLMDAPQLMNSTVVLQSVCHTCLDLIHNGCLQVPANLRHRRSASTVDRLMSYLGLGFNRQRSGKSDDLSDAADTAKAETVEELEREQAAAGTAVGEAAQSIAASGGAGMGDGWGNTSVTASGTRLRGTPHPARCQVCGKLLRTLSGYSRVPEGDAEGEDIDNKVQESEERAGESNGVSSMNVELAGATESNAEGRQMDEAGVQVLERSSGGMESDQSGDVAQHSRGGDMSAGREGDAENWVLSAAVPSDAAERDSCAQPNIEPSTSSMIRDASIYRESNSIGREALPSIDGEGSSGAVVNPFVEISSLSKTQAAALQELAQKCVSSTRAGLQVNDSMMNQVLHQTQVGSGSLSPNQLPSDQDVGTSEQLDKQREERLSSNAAAGTSQRTATPQTSFDAPAPIMDPLPSPSIRSRRARSAGLLSNGLRRQRLPGPLSPKASAGDPDKAAAAGGGGNAAVEQSEESDGGSSNVSSSSTSLGGWHMWKNVFRSLRSVQPGAPDSFTSQLQPDAERDKDSDNPYLKKLILHLQESQSNRLKAELKAATAHTNDDGANADNEDDALLLPQRSISFGGKIRRRSGSGSFSSRKVVSSNPTFNEKSPTSSSLTLRPPTSRSAKASAETKTIALHTPPPSRSSFTEGFGTEGSVARLADAATTEQSAATATHQSAHRASGRLDRAASTEHLPTSLANLAPIATAQPPHHSIPDALSAYSNADRALDMTGPDALPTSLFVSQAGMLPEGALSTSVTTQVPGGFVTSGNAHDGEASFALDPSAPTYEIASSSSSPPAERQADDAALTTDELIFSATPPAPGTPPRLSHLLLNETTSPDDVATPTLITGSSNQPSNTVVTPKLPPWERASFEAKLLEAQQAQQAQHVPAVSKPESSVRCADTPASTGVLPSSTSPPIQLYPSCSTGAAVQRYEYTPTTPDTPSSLPSTAPSPSNPPASPSQTQPSPGHTPTTTGQTPTSPGQSVLSARTASASPSHPLTSPPDNPPATNPVSPRPPMSPTSPTVTVEQNQHEVAGEGEPPSGSTTARSRTLDLSPLKKSLFWGWTSMAGVSPSKPPLASPTPRSCLSDGEDDQPARPTPRRGHRRAGSDGDQLSNFNWLSNLSSLTSPTSAQPTPRDPPATARSMDSSPAKPAATQLAVSSLQVFKSVLPSPASKAAAQNMHRPSQSEPVLTVRYPPEDLHINDGVMDPSAHLHMLEQLSARRVIYPGEVLVVEPVPGLASWGVSSIMFQRPELPVKFTVVGLDHDVLRYADEELAHHLRGITVGALCRYLSLGNIITILSALLLEQKIVLMCPSVSILAAVTLSLVPLLQPFMWQNLFMPVLPANLGVLLQSPAPFVLGVVCTDMQQLLHPPYALDEESAAGLHAEMQNNWAAVDILQDMVILGDNVPKVKLPNSTALSAALKRLHATLNTAGTSGWERSSTEGSGSLLPPITSSTSVPTPQTSSNSLASHSADSLVGASSTQTLSSHSQPTATSTLASHLTAAAASAGGTGSNHWWDLDASHQAAACEFCLVVNQHLGSHFSDLRKYSIARVDDAGARVPVLMDEVFVDSFCWWDRPFMKEFVTTRMFQVHSDRVLQASPADEGF